MLNRRLFLYAAGLFVPLAALLAYGLYHDRQDAVASAHETVMRMTRAASTHQRRLLERSQNLAATLASLPAVRAGDTQTANAVFASVVRNFPEYPNVRLSDLRGEMIASAMPNAPASSNRGRDWFDEVIRTSNYAMSGYFVGVTTGKPVVVLGFPVLDASEHAAYVLSVTIDLASLADASGEELPSGTTVTVIGRTGRVLAGNAAGRRAQGTTVDPELLEAIRLGAPEGVFDARGPEGEPQIVSYVALPVASHAEGVYITVHVPSDTVLTPVNRAVFVSGGGVLVLVAFVFSLGAAGGRRLFVSPVQTLRTVMGNLAAGDLEARTPESLRRDPTEFGDLARSLDSLAAQLHRREVALAVERDRLRAIFDAFGGYGLLLAPDGTIAEANATALRRRGLERDRIIGLRFLDVAGFSPERRSQVASMIDRAFAGDTVRDELTMLGDQNVERIVEATFSPIRSADGSIVNVVGFGVDVTERRKAEADLRMRERELAAIYTNVADVLFYVAVEPDDRFRFVSVNPAFTRATGLPADAVVGRYVEDIVPEPSLHTVLVKYRQAVRTGQVVSWEETSVYPAGTKHGLVSIAPVVDAQGRCTHLTGSVHDSTEVRASQDALRASEERLRLAMRASRMGFYDIDLRTGEAQTNDDYALMLGYDPATFRESVESWLQRVHDDDRTVVEQALTAYLAGRTPVYEVEFRQRTQSGAWVWIHSIGAIVARDGSGRPTRVIGTHLDVTARVAAQAALRASESNLRRAEELAALGHFEFDMGGGEPLWSDGLKLLFGFARDSHPSAGDVRARVHPDDLDAVTPEVRSAISDRRPFTCEFRVIRPDGTTRTMTAHGEVVNNPDTGRPRAFGAVLDISEVKAAEQRLIELNATLEHRVVARTRQLEAANRELESFSYSVSHDLRAPLRAIDGFSRALLEEHAKQLPDDARADLGRIRAAAQRMGELIDAMLQMSRLLRGPIDIEMVDVSELGRQIAAELVESDPDSRAVVSVADGLGARADRRLLRAALTNLVDNALKFSARVASPHIEIGQCEADGTATLFVRDNGVGFDMAYADKLFLPFERLHRPQDFPGHGIGLTTVQRIVSRHGGRVWAEGEPGRGATFFLQLDRA